MTDALAQREKIRPQHARCAAPAAPAARRTRLTPARLTRRAVSADDQVKAYIKKIMSQLDKWMVGGKISKLVIVITDKDTGEHVERWQFDVRTYAPPPPPLALPQP